MFKIKSKRPSSLPSSTKEYFNKAEELVLIIVRI